MVTELIAVKNIAFAYEKKEVFSDLSLSLESGEICCLIGSNGCGKTTLLDCILGIHQVNGGEIFVENKNIKE